MNLLKLTQAVKAGINNLKIPNITAESTIGHRVDIYKHHDHITSDEIGHIYTNTPKVITVIGHWVVTDKSRYDEFNWEDPDLFNKIGDFFTC